MIGTSIFLNERHLKYQVQIKLDYCGTQLLNLRLPDVGSLCNARMPQLWLKKGYVYVI